jgi:hypothetical protein
MGLEIVGDFLVVTARGSEEILGELARSSESESHRYPRSGRTGRG